MDTPYGLLGPVSVSVSGRLRRKKKHTRMFSAVIYKMQEINRMPTDGKMTHGTPVVKCCSARKRMFK